MDPCYTSQCYSQPGLSYVSFTSVFATLTLTDDAKKPKALEKTYDLLRQVVSEVTEHTLSQTAKKQSNAALRNAPLSPTEITDAVIFGVNPGLWTRLCLSLKRSLPNELKNGAAVDRVKSILNCSPPYKDSGGDLYFHIKSDSLEDCRKVYEKIKKSFESISKEIICTEGNPFRQSRVYGRKILHGLIMTVDPINLSARVLIDDEDGEHLGACFGLSQKFIHNWSLLGEMQEAEIENMIGRDFNGNILPSLEEQSHMRCARVKDKDDMKYTVFTQGQPFGNSSTGHSREEGVYVSAFAKSLDTFDHILGGMLGESYKQSKEIKDKHFRYSSSIEGNVWYIPSAREIGLEPAKTLKPVEINSFFQIKSKSKYMYYNSKDFLHRIWYERHKDSHPLTDRVINLLGTAFSRWHNSWYDQPVFPYLPSLESYLTERKKGEYTKKQVEDFLNSSVAERKGLATKFTLGDLFSNEEYCRKMDLFRLSPNEVIVGVIPPFTLGTGVPVMTYLKEDERLNGFCATLDETSMAGHIVPGYPVLLKKGIGRLIEEAKEKLKKEGSEEKRSFYRSVIYSLEGASDYFKNYGLLAEKVSRELRESQKEEKENLRIIADRMKRLSTEPPRSFIDALQMVFGMHCCLHLAGELVSIGRLDKWLMPFYSAESISAEKAQEAIDCFWIKMDEKVLMNRQYYKEVRSYGTCAISGSGGAAVPLGDKISQWVMQVTVGGYDCSGEANPDAVYNEITEMCLRSARRLPLNSPCLSLRLTKKTPDHIIEEASKAILSGGAAPFLFNDELLIKGLLESGPAMMDEKDARNYCADGCWETILPGQTEFWLSYVNIANALEMALNQGSTYVNAGTNNIRGSQSSFLSPPANEIKSFEQFCDIFFEHYKWMIVKFYYGIFQGYGALNKFCPSPLISSLLEGCLESGRDLTNAGAKYHLLAPILFGITSVIDSLWSIKKMVYDPKSAVTDLPELLTCLLSDWGFNMVSPFDPDRGGPERSSVMAMRFKQLRQVALGIPKFGLGCAEVDEFAGKIASRIKAVVTNVLNEPEKQVSREFKALIESVSEKYSLPGKKFAFNLTPAFGTFEDYIGLGLQNGASADGRRKGGSFSSNFSPNCTPNDLPVPDKTWDAFSCLKGWNGRSFDDVLKVCTPLDINIPEDFSLKSLEKLLKKFSLGKLGSNLLSISCTDIETMENAKLYPERYDLVRMRMGGWSEFFIVMYEDHQEQHLRRPMFSDKPGTERTVK